MRKAKVQRFGVSVPEQLVKAFDQLIEAKGYRTRSEAIRDMMRAYLVEADWESDAGEVIGIVTFVFDHSEPEMTRVLTSLQHQFLHAIICATHLHVDEENCLEVVVVRGSAQQVRTIADRLISTRGVKHGKLVCTTTGRALE